MKWFVACPSMGWMQRALNRSEAREIKKEWEEYFTDSLEVHPLLTTGGNLHFGIYISQEKGSERTFCR